MRILILICYILITNELKSQEFIKEPYYFIGVDEMHVYKQSNDTLTHYTTFSAKPNPKLDNIQHYYKIYANEKLKDNYSALKIERLHTFLMTTQPYPEDRFIILIYKIRENEILLVQTISGLKFNEMLNYKLDTANYCNNNGHNYYSQTYMHELLKLKRVKTKYDADLIINELNNPLYVQITDDYQKSNRMPEMYASGLMAMLINKACLKLGYSPIGASAMINILVSEKYDEVTKNKMIAEYYDTINPE